MAGRGNASIGHWIAIVGIILAVPGSLVALQALRGEESGPSTTTEATTAGEATTPDPTTDDETTPEAPEVEVPSASVGSDLDVSDCVITVDHIGAQIHAEPSHAARVLSSVPDGDYRPLQATEADWAGLTEIWYLLDVDGRTGWLAYSTITVPSISAGCP